MKIQVLGTRCALFSVQCARSERACGFCSLARGFFDVFLFAGKYDISLFEGDFGVGMMFGGQGAICRVCSSRVQPGRRKSMHSVVLRGSLRALQTIPRLIVIGPCSVLQVAYSLPWLAIRR